MKPASCIRDKFLDAERASKKPAADYYERVFDRWARLNMRGVMFPPRHVSGMIYGSFDLRGEKHLDAITEIADAISSHNTRRAFLGRVCGVDGPDMRTVYIDGIRHCIVGRKEVLRFMEILSLYDILGPSAAADEAASGLGVIIERGAAA